MYVQLISVFRFTLYAYTNFRSIFNHYGVDYTFSINCLVTSNLLTDRFENARSSDDLTMLDLRDALFSIVIYCIFWQKQHFSSRMN